MQLPTKPTNAGPALWLLAAALSLTGARQAAAADYPTTILNDQPAAYYRFEDPAGSTTIADVTGNGFNGSVNYDLDINGNPDYPKLGQPGIDTNSILFHVYTDTNAEVHSSDVAIGYSQILNPQGPFSVEFWARPTSDANTYEIPVGNFGGYSTDSGWHFYQSPGTPGSWIWTVPSTGQFIQTVPVVKNQWAYIVGVYDGTNLIFYVNGVATATVSGAGYLANDTGDLFIGGDPITGWGNWEGYVDEVAIYTNALTLAQVTNHYAVGLTNFASRSDPPTVLTDLGEATTDPASVSVNVGSTATLDPIVTGATPLYYQWYENGALDPGATNNLLSFSATLAENGSTYYVIVTNSFGSSTSQVATINVAGALYINGFPQSILRNVGSYAAFHVTASGAAPIKYQWSVSSDGGTTFTPVAGATNDTLWLSNVQMSQNGNEYSVFVQGPVLSSNVPPATLSVQARTEIVPLTGYGAIVAADQPVAYWRLDEPPGSGTAVDAVGTFDGTYTAGVVGGIAYDIPTGIPKTTDPAIALTNGPDVAGGASIQIPFAPELNSDTAWSVESWVEPYSLGVNGGDYRVVLSSEYNFYPNPYNGWYLYQQPNNTFAFVPQPANAFVVAGSVAANQWYHLVVTDDGVNFRFYINGVLATAAYTTAGFIANGAGINADGTAGIGSGLGNTVLGQRTDAAFNSFDGAIDDTAIYNYALTPEQVYLHYIVATKIAIAQAGRNVIVTWPVGLLQQAASIAGPYTNVAGATSPYTNAITATPTYYRVHVP
ncbi:MAG: LamG-like jellyroll fold domain-containing protein [Verrucomicrobiota bacterium]